jgi:bifunctional oligoribonuclease and PAP phosphatase NrnA
MMTTEFDEALREAARAIAAADALAITCHLSPDGDALGSALGLAHAARAAGKEAVVSFGSPFVVPDSMGFLDTGPLVPPDEFPGEPACMVVFDTGSPDRLAELGSAANAAGTLIVVDHHMTNSGFGDIRVIDPSAAASAQLAVYLLDALGWEIDARVATCLLTGIVNDTGRFQYSSTTGEVLRLAARLVDAGAVPEVIGQNVYEAVSFGYLAVSAAVLGRAVLEEDLGMVWSRLDADDLEAAGVRYDEAEGLIDDLRIAREAGVAVLLKEVERGWKVSLRSRGEVDVGSIAAAHGGGGHHNAAGFTSGEAPDTIMASIRSHLHG